MRLHREGRVVLAPGVGFTLLDEYQRFIIPNLRITYHPTDWLGISAWGGYAIPTQTNLASQLQEVAIDSRNCSENSSSKACRLTAVNLTRKDPGGVAGVNQDGSPRSGFIAQDQLGAMTGLGGLEVTAVPFRGKIALFASVFADADISFFAGPAVVGLRERKPCGHNDDNSQQLDPCSKSFSLADRVAFAPTFGLEFNFYVAGFFGFGAAFRGLPFSWNTSGFDNHGTGQANAYPDQAVNGADGEFKFNSMINVYLSFALPTKIKSTE